MYPMCLVFIRMVLLFFSAMVNAEMVVKTGVAYPQSNMDYGNIERLRSRAIHDAIEMALMDVQGAQILAERGDYDYSKQRYTGRDDRTSNTFEQQTAYHSNTKTRVRGGVKLVKVIREWQEGEKYLVKLKLDVLSNGELRKSLSAGTLWQQIGRPGITLDVRASRNRGPWWKEPTFQNYLSSQLSKNEILTLADNKGRYRIKVWQSMENSYLQEYGTWKTLCELSFSIIDRQAHKNRSVQRLRAGPTAGFSEKEAEDNCLETSSEKFSRLLLEELVALFNGEWVNGRDFNIYVKGISGNDAGKIQQVLGDVLGVTAVENVRFADDELSLNLTYQGQPLELEQAIVLALDEEGIQIGFQELRGNRINFIWRSATN